MSFRKTLAPAILLVVTMSGLRAQEQPASTKAVPAKAAQAPAPTTSAPKPVAQPAVPAKQSASTAAKPAQTPAPATSAPKPAAHPAVPAKQSASTTAKPEGQPKVPAGQPATVAKLGPAVKPAASKPAAKKPAAKKKPEETTVASAEVNLRVPRRDPFESLIGREQAGAGLPKNLPPGKAGLQVSTLRLDGVVKAPNGMIAVVSNPQMRTYFLREGDQLYDGRVEKIMMDGISFHEVGKDAFGKPVERQVNKRIYASAGELQ